MDGCRRPAGIVELRAFEAHLRRGGIVALHELRVISNCPERRIAGVPGRLEGRVRCKHLAPVGMEIEDKAVTVVARNPHTVHQPLIVRMHGNDVASLMEQSRHVDLVVVRAVGRPCRRSHPGERAVHVKPIVVVRRDADRRRLHVPVQLERLAEEYVPVLQGLVDRRQLLRLELPHRVGARRLARHFGIGYPGAGERLYCGKG